MGRTLAMAMTSEEMAHLNFMKKQQWNVAYYAILLLAAVFAVKKAFEPSLVLYERWLGTLLCFGILVGAGLLLTSSNATLAYIAKVLAGTGPLTRAA
jgi:protein-S-isoprenylcysteine O-methyltransferase Ste14